MSKDLKEERSYSRNYADEEKSKKMEHQCKFLRVGAHRGFWKNCKEASAAASG